MPDQTRPDVHREGGTSSAGRIGRRYVLLGGALLGVVLAVVLVVALSGSKGDKRANDWGKATAPAAAAPAEGEPLTREEVLGMLEQAISQRGHSAWVDVQLKDPEVIEIRSKDCSEIRPLVRSLTDTLSTEFWSVQCLGRDRTFHFQETLRYKKTAEPDPFADTPGADVAGDPTPSDSPPAE